MPLRLITLLIPLAVLAIACGGGSSSATPSPAPSTSPTTPAPQPTSTVKTGIASVDAIIAAVTSGDTAAVQSRIRYTPTACEAAPQGIGAPPVCQAGEPEGTKVDVFQMAQCEGFYVRPADLRLEIPQSATLYGVYRIGETFWPAGKYAAIFERSQPEAGATAWELILDDDGIVGVHLGCAMTPPQMVSFQRLTDTIIAPGTSPTSTASPAATP